VRLIRKFLERVGSNLQVNEDETLKINNKRFTVTPGLGEYIVRWDKLVSAGRFLGKDRNDFHPSSILLSMLSSEPDLNKIYVDRDTAWLFVCGRDIFEKNILRVEGEFELGEYFLVMLDAECLGYGKITKFEDMRILRNIFDIGDFLRRER